MDAAQAAAEQWVRPVAADPQAALDSDPSPNTATNVLVTQMLSHSRNSIGVRFAALASSQP